MKWFRTASTPPWRPLFFRLFPPAVLAPPLLFSERCPAPVSWICAVLLGVYVLWRLWGVRCLPALGSLTLLFGLWGLLLFVTLAAPFPSPRFFLFLTGLAALVAPLPAAGETQQTGRWLLPLWGRLVAVGAGGLAVLAPLLGDVYWRRKYFHFDPPAFLQTGELIDTNILAAVLAAALPAAVVGIFRGARPSGWRDFSKLGAFVALALGGELILTQSRAAWLGAAAGMAYLAWRRWTWLRWVCAAGGGGLVILVGTLGLSPLIDWLARSAEVYTASGRVAVWEASLPAVADFAWTGIGPGRFLEVVPALYYSDVPITPDSAWKHAHNVYLQVALDLGLPGLVLLAALAVCAFRAAGCCERTAGWWARAVTAGLVVLAVNGLVDAPLWLNKPHAFLFFLVGVAAAAGRLPIAGVRPPSVRVVLGVLGIWLLASAVAAAVAGWEPRAALVIAVLLGGTAGWIACRWDYGESLTVDRNSP